MAECHCGKDGHPLGSVNCPVHGTWRSIETAPKDGTEFDGWGYALPDSGCAPSSFKYERYVGCFWGKRDSHYVKPKEGWCSTGHDGWSWAMVLTHWMPPPEPPFTHAGSEGKT